MTPQDPDIAALVARLGLRGMHYHSFGNRPVSTPAAEPASSEPQPGAVTPPVPTAALPPPVLVAPNPGPAPTALPATLAEPTATLADFPLLAAALRAAPSTSSPAPTEATLVFLGLRTARTTQGR